MTTQRQRNLRKLWTRFKYFIVIGGIIFAVTIFFALLIYSLVPEKEASVWHRVAEFLMSIAETVLLAGLIGGGINFALEEMKKDDDAVKERLKSSLESKQKHQLFCRELRKSLGVVHDNVGLARILIKSHKSGKTYGEQIRNRIMPSLVSLQDLRRELPQLGNARLEDDLDAFRVSLNYMIAYLSVLVREFEANYLSISNLQNYQDAYGAHLRGIFTEVVASHKEEKLTPNKKQQLIEKASNQFDDVTIPDKIDAVWQAIGEIKFVSDFIAELRGKKGDKSDYFIYFLTHYNHCTGILRSQDEATEVNKGPKKEREKSIKEKKKFWRRVTSDSKFVENLKILKDIDDKQREQIELTNKDLLTWKIMEEEMGFDLKVRGEKKAE